MGALSPFFLLAGLAIGVPLFLHLFQRQEVRRVSFPALRYLERTEREHARRIRLRQLLLMLARVAVVLALVGAGARLFLRGTGAAHPPTAVVLILDNSMSSGLVLGEERALDRLRTIALQTLDAATRDDVIWVLRAGEPWLPAVPGGPDEARPTVLETTVSAGAGDLSQSLARASELLGTSALEAREIHLVSDLQRTAFDARVSAPALDVPVVVWGPRDPAAPNRALTSVLVGGGLPPLEGQRTEVTVAAAEDPDGDTVPSPIRVVVDEVVRGAGDLPPGASLSLPLPSTPSGWVQGYVDADPDNLRADDRRFFAFRARPAPSVSVVGDPGVFAAEAISVLESAGRTKPSTVSAADAVISGSGEGLTSVGSGKAALVVPPEDPTRLPALNRRLADAGIPWRLERRDERGEADVEGADLPEPLVGTRARLWYRLVLSGDPPAPTRTLGVVVGDPWLVSGTDASGRRYLLLASPLDPGSSTLPVSAQMVRFVDWVVSEWAAAGGGPVERTAGHALTAPGGAERVRLPSGAELPIDGARRVLATGEVGFYTFSAGDSTVAVEAVNPPARESDLRRLEDGVMDARIGSNTTRVRGDGAWARSIFQERQGPELWRILLAMALALLVIESALAATGRLAVRHRASERGGRPVERSDPILSAVATCDAFAALAQRLPGPGHRTSLGGLHGSADVAVLAALHQEQPERVFVALTAGPREASAVEADLEALLGESGRSALYPQKEALPYDDSEPHLEIGGLRVEAVEALFSGRARVLVTTPRALQERVPIPAHLTRLRLTVRVGESVDLRKFALTLEARGFERVALVEEVGQFAVRGGIVDVFSVGAGDPVRIELWGDEVASIRSFDILDQRSVDELRETHVLPVDFLQEEEGEETESRSLLDFLPGDAVVTILGEWDVRRDAEHTWERVANLYTDLVDSGASPPTPSSLFLEPDELVSRLEALPHLILQEDSEADGVLHTSAPPLVDRDMSRLKAYLRVGGAREEETLLLCDNDGQLQRLEEILGGPNQIPPGTRLGLGSLAEGFELPDASPPLRVVNDHEIFRRARRLRRTRRFRGAVALESLAQLRPGDFVVHMDHGVGRFAGLEHIEVAGEEMEVLAIEYAGEEVLRLPVYRLDLIERWVGETEDAEPPQVHRIGGKRWKTLRRRTETAIEEMTSELLELYAQRATASGHAFPPDTRWQKEMESSFLYEDTPDQRKAAEDVKKDLESTRPMDRLVCGDVGYGKTEVAIRAAFKAIQDGKQVAVLAPTTILVEQHRHTFGERLADYPVTVGALSRFRSPKESRNLLGKVANGEVDIVVGTHRLLSEDVVFKDLGLLIIDEEQRFGVKHKERLKRMRASVDVLTLTATPIPRTLYLSLSGIRDLSLIRTPPRDRMPIFTHVLPWTDQILAEALHRELDRGGQAFFLHNRVETIYTIAEEIRALVPEATISVAHGQMGAGDLDEVMREFVDGEVDVLVCSSIIENGLDVPNANTLIVDRADRFGLSQLYQIRGRVGRSDRRAYCYLLVPEELPEDAARRLRVLEHYTELGSGYSVALKDLELRGAGSLLGASQSGFAHQVGLDTYLRLMEKTVERLQKGEQAEEFQDPDVSLAGPAFLPEGYVADSGQKLHLYRRLSKVRRRPEVGALAREMADRFGSLPQEVERLLDATAIRILGRAVGAERILIRDRSARISFRQGVVPRVAVLEGPLRQRQVEVEVRRMDPLSLVLHQVGVAPLAETVMLALEALRAARDVAA